MPKRRPTRATYLQIGRSFAIVVGWLVVALVLTWPLALGLTTHLLGMPDTDQADTAWLRLAVARGLGSASFGHTHEVFAPAGYPLLAVVPNLVDHVLGAPAALLLPFPLADNLTWLGVLTANGVAGHVLGRRLGGTHWAGALTGMALMIAEPVLREAALGHAPQALVCWAPLYIAALLAGFSPGGTSRHAVAAASMLALSALTYWYQGLFLAVLTLPFFVASFLGPRGNRPMTALRWLTIAAATAALCALPLGVAMWWSADLASLQVNELSGSLAPQAEAIPAMHRWAFMRGGDVLWPVRPTPAVISSRVSVVVVGAAVVGSWRIGWRRAWPWWVAAGLGSTLLMGPYLKLGESALTLGGSPIPLPWAALAAVSDLLARLHWPERWGIVVSLALLPLVARAVRPGWWAAAALVETLLLSANAPIPTRPVWPWQPWQALQGTDGLVLVVPPEQRALEAAGDVARSSRAFGYRVSGVPLANPMNLPPTAPAPVGYDAFRASNPVTAWVDALCAGEAPSPPPDIDGLAAVVLDLTPAGAVGEREGRAWRTRLTAAWGEPVDYGGIVVWWANADGRPPGLADPDAWRAETRQALVGEIPARRPSLCTAIHRRDRPR